MASGDDVTLTFANNGLINLVINKQTAADALGITNSGTITADGGQVTLANFTGATAANGNVNPNWDFTTVWFIYDGNTYPSLRSFLLPLTITANNVNKTYDGLVYSGGGAAYSGFAGGDTSAVLGGALTVNPAPLTVTANADSKIYDGLAYSGGNGVTYGRFVNGETSAVLGGALNYGGTSQGAVNAGNYAITPSGLTAANYTISYIDGVLTITAASTGGTTIGGTTTTTTTGGTTTNTVISKVDYTNVIEEWLGNFSGNEENKPASQTAKYEVAYASSESPVFTYMADGARPLITEERIRKNKRLCLIVGKDKNPMIVETECK